MDLFAHLKKFISSGHKVSECRTAFDHTYVFVVFESFLHYLRSIDEIIKQQSFVRSTMRQILELHKQEENSERGSKIETLLKSLSGEKYIDYIFY